MQAVGRKLDLQQHKTGYDMHWLKIEHSEVPLYICIETGIQLRLNHNSKKEWGIHSTGFGGIIKVLSKDRAEAEKQFFEFMSKLTQMEINT